MNRRTGNIRRKQPKRRYHDRRGLADAKPNDEVPGVRRGIEVSACQGSLEMFINPDAKLKAENEGLRKSIEDLQHENAALRTGRQSAVLRADAAEAKAKQDAQEAEWQRQLEQTRCSCGYKLPSTYDSTYVCHCGRQFEPPKLNVHRVLARISELEERVKQLEAVIRTKPEGS